MQHIECVEPQNHLLHSWSSSAGLTVRRDCDYCGSRNSQDWSRDEELGRGSLGWASCGVEDELAAVESVAFNRLRLACNRSRISTSLSAKTSSMRSASMMIWSMLNVRTQISKALICRAVILGGASIATQAALARAAALQARDGRVRHRAGCPSATASHLHCWVGGRGFLICSSDSQCPLGLSQKFLTHFMVKNFLSK